MIAVVIIIVEKGSVIINNAALHSDFHPQGFFHFPTSKCVLNQDLVLSVSCDNSLGDAIKTHGFHYTCNVMVCKFVFPSWSSFEVETETFI